MILLRFDTDEIKNCKTVADVFKMFGIGSTEKDGCGLLITNKDVFGGRAYYKNLIMHPDTSKAIFRHLKSVKHNKDEDINKKITTAIVLDWVSCAPMSSGEKFDNINDSVGVSEDVLYILTPEDPLHEEYVAEE